MNPDSLEARVTTLETQVHDLAGRVRASEHDAVAARVLAGAADRDVGEIRGELRDFRNATTASFNALREDMRDLHTEMNDRFAHVDEQFNHIDEQFHHIAEQFNHIAEQFNHIAEQFNQVDNGFIGIRGKLDAAAAGQQRIVELIEALGGDQGSPHD